MDKFTKGEWTTHPYSDLTPRPYIHEDVERWFASHTIGSGDKMIATVLYGTGTSGHPTVDDLEEFKANARLIKSAPLLLDMIRQIAHSVKQATIVGNDWRRELNLIENLSAEALSLVTGEGA